MTTFSERNTAIYYFCWKKSLQAFYFPNKNTFARQKLLSKSFKMSTPFNVGQNFILFEGLKIFVFDSYIYSMWASMFKRLRYGSYSICTCSLLVTVPDLFPYVSWTCQGPRAYIKSLSHLTLQVCKYSIITAVKQVVKICYQTVTSLKHTWTCINNCIQDLLHDIT